jgi:seryl-tRNA synthetase
MLDLKAIREDPQPFRAGLARRGVAAELERLIALDEEERQVKTRVEELRAEKNRASKEIGRASSEERQRLIEAQREVTAELESLESDLERLTDEVQTLLARLPNLPHESVPDGASDDDNRVEREVGDRPSFGFDPRDHVEIGELLQAIDIERAARTSGSRFAYLLGPSVWLQWALVRYALDVVTAHGFTPVIPPVLVREEAMFGTGFLPTDEAQLYVTREDDLYLVGTSEVPLASFHQDEIVEPSELPIRYAGYSTCFRREAGTYGKDTRGILRLHQFDKVEMFSFCEPERSWEEHDLLVSIQEEILQSLGLAYRVVTICTGELGAPAAKKIDLEAWLPGQGKYRELTSCSNCTDYQARRLGVRMRGQDANRPVHTLNGTATAIGRTLIAIFENYQREDGSVEVPEVLRPYLPESQWVLKPLAGSSPG